MVLELINEAKHAGAALIGIFHDRLAREAVADRVLDMTPQELPDKHLTAKELLQC